MVCDTIQPACLNFFRLDVPAKKTVNVGQVLLTPDEFFKKHYTEVIFPRSTIGK